MIVEVLYVLFVKSHHPYAMCLHVQEWNVDSHNDM